MRRILTVMAVTVLGACGGGGGGGGGVVHDKPTIELVSPLAGSTMSGAATITVKATGDGVLVKSLVFTAPAGCTGAEAAKDNATFSATLSADVSSMEYPDGILTVNVTATDADDQQTTASYNFLVANAAQQVTLDANYLSFYDEANVQIGQSGGVAVVPAQYLYASTDKVGVVDGASISKIVSRLAWVGATPSGADLNANAYNLPVLRVLTPHGGADPAIASAKATVTVGTGASVTVDLIADTTSPAGKQAYLLPLASNLFADLAALTTVTDVKVAVVVKDALNHTATGGTWTVHLTPMAPPVVAVVDGLYASSSDARSVFPYSAGNYANLWGNAAGFALDNGARVYHVRITNPFGAPVSVGANLTGAKTWGLTESWAKTSANSNYMTYTWTCTGGGSGTPTCSAGVGTPHNSLPKSCSGSTPVIYKPAGSSTWACGATSYASGPASVSVTPAGALTVKAYVAGTTTPATKSGSRYIVPAAVGSNPGLVDVYVVRPITGDRGTNPLLDTWSGTAFGAASWSHISCSGTCSTGYNSGTCTCTQYDWSLQMSHPSETITGSVGVDVQAFDGGTEYGPLATALPAQTLTTPVTH